MNTVKLYRYLASVAGLIGVGMILGYSLGQGTTNTPVWIGGILILLAAVVLGMSLSTNKPRTPSSTQDDLNN